MDERLKFVARLLDGDQMAGLRREFGISRKTGYKILTRYNEVGLEGLTDRSRRPYRTDWLAGAGGFEPPNGGIKIRCLTTWLRPKTRLESLLAAAR